MKYISTKEAAKILKVSHIGIRKKVASGFFPGAIRCLCERKNWLIPVNKINKKEDKNE